MKPNILKTLALAFFWLASAFTAQAKLNVVATLPDFGARRARDRRRQSRRHRPGKPTEDSHFVDARPSFVVQLRQADVLDRRRRRSWRSAGCRRSCKTRAIRRSKSVNPGACRRRKGFA